MTTSSTDQSRAYQPVGRARSATVLVILAALFSALLMAVNPASAAAASSDVTCSSWNSGYAECETGSTITSISVKNQHSNSACTQGHSYGTKGSKIWVNKGCRATFRVDNASGPAPAPAPTGNQVLCESWNSQYKSCAAGGTVLAVSVATQHSNTTCRLGTNYGKSGSNIWVNKGCRATFNVTLTNVHLQAPAQPAGERIVILGDSYISGEGISIFASGCARHDDAYAPRLAAERGVVPTNLSCTGHTIENLRAEQLNQIPNNADIVLLSIGGNNMGFSDYLKCFNKPWRDDCINDQDMQNRLRALTNGGLRDIYRDVLTQAGSNAHLYVMTYPIVLEHTTTWQVTPHGSWVNVPECQGLSQVSGQEAQWADRWNAALNDAIIAAGAANNRVTVIDNEAALVGSCQSSEDIRRIDARRTKASFHPTATGHDRLLNNVRRNVN